MRLEGWHLIIIIAVAVLLFGAPKLPGLARSVGQSLRIFKSEVRQMKEDGNDVRDDKPSPTTVQVLDPTTGMTGIQDPGAVDRVGAGRTDADATSAGADSEAPTGSSRRL